MKVLIIGSKGMLGSDLLSEFSPTCTVLGMDLPAIDIAKPDQCHTIVQEFRPNVIINAAAFARVDDCETKEALAYAVNGEGSGNLAKAAAVAGALLVHYSTDYVFDGLKENAYMEEDVPNPQNVYGKSKLLGETLIRQNCPEHLILRTSWLFGPNGPNFIKTIVNAARGGNPLRVVNDQRGSPSYTKDIAAHTMRMIKAGCRLTYHLTNSGVCTWHELASKALEWAGIKVAIQAVSTEEFPRPAARPRNSALVNAHLERDGLPLMRSWQSAARDYVEHSLKF
jgi:dTDP-4-dehydrorhamnose reductase